VRRDSVPDCSWRCAPQDAVPRQQPAHQHRGHYVAGDVAVSAALHYRVGRVSLGAAPAAASPSPAWSACTVGIYRLGRAAVRRDSVPDCSCRCAPQDAGFRRQPAHHRCGHYVAGDVAVSAALHYRVPRVSLGAATAAASPSPASSACTVGIYRLGRVAVATRSLTAPVVVPRRALGLGGNQLTSIADTTLPATLQ
jgi:hypothetical protein